MRRLAPLLFAILLLLPAAAVSAQSTFPTPNGPRTTAQMTNELHIAGYAGPWTDAAVLAAYVRTTGGLSPSSPGPGVLLLGGIGSDASIMGYTFSDLPAALTRLDGLPPSSIRLFTYATCGALSDAEAQLAAKLRDLRSQRAFSTVALIGHSRGGLVAFQMSLDYPDIGSYVSSVVAVDTPFLGVSSGKAFASEFQYGDCEPAMTELVGRRAAQDLWAVANAANVNYLLGLGVRVRAIGNQSDCAYNLSVCHDFWGAFSSDDTGSQAVVAPGPVQRWYDVPSSQGISASHSAAFHNEAVLEDIAKVVAGR